MLPLIRMRRSIPQCQVKSISWCLHVQRTCGRMHASLGRSAPHMDITTRFTLVVDMPSYRLVVSIPQWLQLHRASGCMHAFDSCARLPTRTMTLLFLECCSLPPSSGEVGGLCLPSFRCAAA